MQNKFIVNWYRTSNVNKYGSENVVMNPEYRKKKVIKLSLVVNKNGFI